MTPAFQPAASQMMEASAGTGKTRTLVARIVAAIASGAAIEEMVAVTFTHAAAGEMKLRLRQELDLARLHADPTTAARYNAALHRLERAFIGTIHSFCAQMLRQRPVEAGVDPAFEEMDQPAAQAVFHGVFERWFYEELARDSAVLRRALRRMLWMEESRGEDPAGTLERAAWALAEWRDFDAPWRRESFDSESEVRDMLPAVDELLDLREKCRNPGYDALYNALQPVADFRERLRNAELLGAWDQNAAESDLLELLHQLKWMREGYGPYGDGVTREQVLTARDTMLGRLRRFAERADADLAVDLRDALWPVVLRYEQAKARGGKLDFHDLLIYGARLLHHDEARWFFQRRYQRIFVDEFQDTDPLQAEILLLLTADDAGERNWRNVTPSPGKLFLVGDPKQSIYRFRRADVESYRSICHGLTVRGVAREALQSSHRSVESLQRFVNAAFEERMPEYLPLINGRPDASNQPAVIALPMPNPYGMRNITKKAINECSPAAVGAFVDWLVNESGWRVSDPREPERLTPIKPEHVCILFRRFTNFGTDLTQEYVRCLESRSIPHVLVGSKSFHGREEVGVLRAALRAVEWPDDELSVFATLRGPLFSISDATLFKFRALHCEKRTMHPYMELAQDLDSEFARIADALRLLAELHRIRNYHPAAVILNRLIEHTRAHAGFAFRKGGERVLANVYRLLDLTRRFEMAGSTSFRALVEYLEAEAETGEASEAPLLEQDAGGVKLMTVHRAKGLEFPVVILADLTAKLTGFEGCSRHVDPDKRVCAQRLANLAPWELLDPEVREKELRLELDEADRLAYVAATRARDLLVVSVVGDGEFSGSWLTPLYDALYPPQDDWRRAHEAPGCPPFGRRSVLSRPPESDLGEISVRPGLHHPRKGEHRLVWFDPAALDLGDYRSAGLEHEDVLTGSPDAGLERYREWREKKEEAFREASRPLHRLERVTEARNLPDAPGVEVRHINLPKHGARPSGRRFGKLVHALLEHAPLPAKAPELRMLVAAKARLLGATPDEADTAVAAALQAFSLDVLQEAVEADRVHRELPVLLKLEDGRMLEGSVDLAYFRDGGWTVIDFKTGPTDERRNERQLKLYARALASSGFPVRAYLIGI